MPHRPHNFRALSKPKQIHKSQHKSYWPYIPVLLLVISTFLISALQPVQRKGVLAYATNTSIDGLLSATNQQRQQNGAGKLALNQNLSAAAQAKANDMVARNYWSHNTPDGQEPWVFINNAGYKYQRAGENLAYGFGTSDDTVTGWMNSPSHRENLLDTAFNDVGFGFANGQDFNSSGPETVVVAMYGQPQVLAANSSTASPPAAAPASNPAAPSLVSSPPNQPTQQQTPETKPSSESKPVPAQTATKPITTDAPIKYEPPTKSVARIQTITGGKAPWALFAVGVITGMAVLIILLKHALGLRHILTRSERLILHHPMLDTILVSIVLLGSLMTHTTGFIR